MQVLLQKNKNLEITRYYSGQVLAVVLIVLVVAAIIALAVISRVQSEKRGVTDERSSEQALALSDSLLTGITTMPITQIATIVNDAAESSTMANLCKGDAGGNYDFWQDGCFLSDTQKTTDFLKSISDLTGDSYFNSLARQIIEETAESCPNSSESVSLSLTPMQEGEDTVLPEGQVYSIMLDSTPSASCSVEVRAKATHASVETGMITRALYFSDSTGFKPYDYTDINGYCLFDCSTSGGLGWQGINPTPPLNNGWVNTFTNGATIMVPTVVDSYTLDEFRILGIKGDVTLNYRTSPVSCVELKQAMRIRATSNCAGNSQGKEIMIPRENWAPAVFDYVIYNGEGVLQYDPI